MNRLITAEKTAVILGVSKGAVWGMIRRGLIPTGVAIRIGRAVRISEAELGKWLANGGTNTNHRESIDSAGRYEAGLGQGGTNR
jgi:excisionase family DNA binding protein